MTAISESARVRTRQLAESFVDDLDKLGFRRHSGLVEDKYFDLYLERFMATVDAADRTAAVDALVKLEVDAYESWKPGGAGLDRPWPRRLDRPRRVRTIDSPVLGSVTVPDDTEAVR